MTDLETNVDIISAILKIQVKKNVWAVNEITSELYCVSQI